ncbi:hypothetical protein ACLBXI_22755, partial [Bacillus cereus]
SYWSLFFFMFSNGKHVFVMPFFLTKLSSYVFLMGERKQKVDLKLEENTLTVHHEFMGGTKSVKLVRSE